MHHHYRLYGLRISSEIELPELAQEPAWDDPQALIRLERLPEPVGRSGELVAEDEAASFVIEGVAQYRVRSGREILVDPHPEASVRNVQLYLLGSALGLLVHQRGGLPLHANAIEIDGRGYAFMGASGSGKSTLAAAFHDRGHRVIADDVCVVSFEDRGIVAHCGVPRLRLWEDALTASGRSATDYRLAYAGDDQYRKFDVPTAREGTASMPLSAIIELSSADEIRCERLTGLEAIEAIFANTYRGAFVSPAGATKAHWQACIQLVSAIPVFRLQRPLQPELTPQIVAQFEGDCWQAMADESKVANN